MMTTLQRAARLAARLFGGVLLGAVVLKLIDPAATLIALRTAGLSEPAAAWTFSGINLMETILGGVLLFGRPSYRALRITAVACAVMWFGHRILRVLIDEVACGCFGAIGVSDTGIAILLATGFASCAIAGWRPLAANSTRDARRANWLGVAALGLAASVASLGVHHQDSNAVARAALTAKLDAPAVVIIGSPDCGRCKTLLTGAARWVEAGDDRQCVVFYPAGQAGSGADPAASPSSRIRTESLAELAWFELAHSSPPTVYRWNGRRLELEDAPWDGDSTVAEVR